MMTTKLKAEALAKAALQATARALHTAQLAKDAYGRAAEDDAGAHEDGIVMAALRDKLLDAYAGIPERAKTRMLASKATITSDELIDLLALCVRGS